MKREEDPLLNGEILIIEIQKEMRDEEIRERYPVVIGSKIIKREMLIQVMTIYREMTEEDLTKEMKILVGEILIIEIQEEMIDEEVLIREPAGVKILTREEDPPEMKILVGEMIDIQEKMKETEEALNKMMTGKKPIAK